MPCRAVTTPVTTNVWTVRRAPGRMCHDGLLQLGNGGHSRVIRCKIGRSGISPFKREGDGATPLASMRLLGGYLRQSAWTVRNRELQPITNAMGWCDEPTHACYNRPVSLPFAASHEMLEREDSLYDACLVLDWNITRRQRQRGSAIFFHLIRDDGGATAGCIAVSRRHMDRLLRNLPDRLEIRVVI
ncbi:MAG: L,D-transpeptidase family protein [Nitratireductor sp.]